VLNEEQQTVERRVDQLRWACQNVSKKVQSCLNSQGKPVDADKRMVLYRCQLRLSLIASILSLNLPPAKLEAFLISSVLSERCIR